MTKKVWIFTIICAVMVILIVGVKDLVPTIVSIDSESQKEILYIPDFSYVDHYTGELKERDDVIHDMRNDFYAVDNITHVVYFYNWSNHQAYLSPVYDADGSIMTYERLLEIYEEKEEGK